MKKGIDPFGKLKEIRIQNPNIKLRYMIGIKNKPLIGLYDHEL